MSVAKQGRKHQFPHLARVLLRQRQVSNKVNSLLICVSAKCHFGDRMFRGYASYEKWVQYVSSGVKEWS